MVRLASRPTDEGELQWSLFSVSRDIKVLREPLSSYPIESFVEFGTKSSFKDVARVPDGLEVGVEHQCVGSDAC